MRYDKPRAFYSYDKDKCMYHAWCSRCGFEAWSISPIVAVQLRHFCRAVQAMISI